MKSLQWDRQCAPATLQFHAYQSDSFATACGVYGRMETWNFNNIFMLLFCIFSKNLQWFSEIFFFIAKRANDPKETN